MKTPELPTSDSQGMRWLIWVGGIIASDVMTLFLYIGVIWFLQLSQLQFLNIAIGLPSFFLVPLFGGVTASFCWRRLKPGVRETALGVLGIIAPGLIGAALLLKEGIICLLIVAPIFYAMIFTGALLGRVWFKIDPTRLRLCVFPLLVMLAAGEPLLRENQSSVVTDTILIHAQAAKVWPELTSFPAINTPPQFWMFRIGLPYPVATTSDGDFVGADRQCIFSGDMVFREKVSVLTPQKDLTFDIVQLPNHPELIGHVTPHRGQFLLHDNGDGTTTLTGNTWYTLHVRPLWYFDLWTQYIFREVHLRVMEDIRKRAEGAS
ncbi:MAG: hypothetical protein ABI443_01310 [Chthoniobacterales bacterium]